MINGRRNIVRFHETWKFDGTVRSEISAEGDKKGETDVFQKDLSLPLHRVPHISLVLREMWDSTNLNVFCVQGNIGGVKRRVSPQSVVEETPYVPVSK
jgi:hypothetical protein